MKQNSKEQSKFDIRPETPRDFRSVFAVNAAAFPDDAEAQLVERLRAAEPTLVSLVATCGAEVVGHILFTPVSVAGHPDLNMMGLAPMAVVPSRQRQGIGSALVERGLAVCRERQISAVVVLGHAEYYPRFGFQRASLFGLQSEYDAPDEAFMALELIPGALDAISGTIKYSQVFSQ